MPLPLRQEMGARFRMLLGVRRPEDTPKGVTRFVAFLVVFFGPMLAFLKVGPHYVLLDERIYYQLAYGLIACTIASFAVGSLNRMLRPWGLVPGLLARFGFSIPVVAGFFTAVVLVNGVGNPASRVRSLACLGKRATYGQRPDYYVRVRPWGAVDREVEVNVPGAVFAATCPGGNVLITTGLGRLGIEWIRRIDVAPPGLGAMGSAGPP